MINTYKSQKPFFMVYAEGGSTPAVKHETYPEAQREAVRLSKKLGVKCYVLASHDEVQVVETTKIGQIEPCKCYWYKITGDKKKDDALKSMLIDLMPDTLYCYTPMESEYRVGRIVYNYHNSIRIENDVDGSFSQIVKMFGTELRIKE